MPIRTSRLTSNRRIRYRLTKKVHIVRKFPTSDFEAEEISEVDVWTAYGEVRPIRGAESDHANQVKGLAGYYVYIRRPWEVSIDVSDWVEVNGMKLEIKAVTDVDGEGEYLELTCQTRNVTIGDQSTR